MPKIVPEKCPQDHACPAVKACPVEALVQKGFNAPEIDESKCISCNKCVETCPRQAIIE